MHAFIKKNMVMVIALLAAAITSIIIPPDRAYLGYFDLKTLTCLFCVLAVVCALKNINFFYMLARKVVKCFKNARMSILALVYITFIGSMLIANDMALLTFLPLGYLVLTTTGKQRYMAFTFVMQNIAANLGGMLTPFGMRVALLTGGMKAAARRTTLAAIRSDEADLVVGTHAILSEGVEFARLGLAVVDEQHRFGVRQRGMLAEKAANPHLLVMSATPIPRTLGLLIYGDLDISILDELPPGRKPVKTRCITGKKRRDLYGFLDREIGAGRQVYIVCPAIEDTPDGGLNAVKSYYEDIAKALLPDRRVGLMHGKLKPKEKAAVMDDFKSGRLDALVSTTVIEVGVDVPNATVMVIENAERYGLSALHQLRGRVGRGAAESWCFLVSDNTAESVQKRLKFLCSTSDGFAVAQFDLETRGPGDFFGSRQHGLPTLQIADLMNDTRTLHAAQAEAAALLAADPLLEAPEHSLLAAQVEQMFTKAGAMN